MRFIYFKFRSLGALRKCTFRSINTVCIKMENLAAGKKAAATRAVDDYVKVSHFAHSKLLPKKSVFGVVDPCQGLLIIMN